MANNIADDNTPYKRLVEQDEGDVPNAESGGQNLFIDEADNLLKRKDSSGTVTDIESDGGESVVVQTVITETGAVATGTTLIPLDDTIPQNTEGNEYMTVSITPTDAANILYIDVTIMVIHSVAAWISAALFQDAVANALAAITGFSTTAGGGVPLHFRHKMVAGGTSAITFKVRAGGHTAGTTTFNGNAGARVFGGVMASSITVQEQTP